MSNISEISDQHCYGCGVCSIVCPGGANLRLDKDGYYKSQVNENECADCGKCLSICPYHSSPVEIKLSPSFVAYCKKREDVLASTSGGIAHEIASRYLELGYTIIGAAWSEDYKRVEHILVNDRAGLEQLRKSKNVQSYTPDAFSKIKSLEKVVVFGTPCQIAGLRNLYGNREGMLLIDFDCMGPAGLGLWDKYVQYVNKLNTSGIKKLEMRYKKKSWMMYGIYIGYEDKKEYFQDKFHDPFCILYNVARTIQNTCLEDCKFLNASMADLRIGDAWNYADDFGRQQVRDGLSLLTSQTERGNEVLNRISEKVVMMETVRVPNKKTSASYNAAIWESIRNPKDTIINALNIYNSVDIKTKLLRKVSYLLSANDTVYLFIKKMLKKLK